MGSKKLLLLTLFGKKEIVPNAKLLMIEISVAIEEEFYFLQCCKLNAHLRRHN
jgi:hypothetical protein